MYLFFSPGMDPCYNLALEEYLVRELPADARCLYLWQNNASVIVGRFQNTFEEVSQACVDRLRIPVVRRMSGGGAVFHDPGTLLFSVLVPLREAENTSPSTGLFPTASGLPTDPPASSLLSPILEALASLGVKASASGRNDLTVDGKKIAGCAAWAQEDRFLFHGCIMLDTDLEMLERVLHVSRAKITSHSIKSVRSRVTTINAHAKEKVSVDQCKKAILDAFSTRETLEPRAFSESDLLQIEKLAEQKYRSWDWNYGDFPSFHIRCERKFPAGLICIHTDVVHGRISRIRITGDFFGDRDLSPLEKSLEGMPLDERLEDRLLELSVENYLSGITAEEFASLLRQVCIIKDPVT